MIYGFADGAVLPKTTSPTLIASRDLKLGETALALSNEGIASTGIVARVSDKGVQTTLPNIGAGSVAVNLSGNVIGISLGETAGLLIGAEEIATLLAATSTITAQQ